MMSVDTCTPSHDPQWGHTIKGEVLCRVERGALGSFGSVGSAIRSADVAVRIPL